jgi:hypothetical protein
VGTPRSLPLVVPAPSAERVSDSNDLDRDVTESDASGCRRGSLKGHKPVSLRFLDFDRRQERSRRYAQPEEQP